MPAQRVYARDGPSRRRSAARPTLLEGAGYGRVRTFFRMVRPLATVGCRRPCWPAGIELRPFDPDRDGDESSTQRSRRRSPTSGAIAGGHTLDWAETVIGGRRGSTPSSIPVAWDGDEIAGVSLNYAKRIGDWGWIGTLAVRPAWRRRGLGLALLHESFRRFADRGETIVALGVDSENPTGATRLYERAGMRVLWRADVWQKELRRDG